MASARPGNIGQRAAWPAGIAAGSGKGRVVSESCLMVDWLTEALLVIGPVCVVLLWPIEEYAREAELERSAWTSFHDISAGVMADCTVAAINGNAGLPSWGRNDDNMRPIFHSYA